MQRYPPTSLKNQFERTFKVRFMDYFEPWTGFDIVKFDEIIKPDDNESTADKIEKEYGQGAVDLISELLNYPKW